MKERKLQPRSIVNHLLQSEKVTLIVALMLIATVFQMLNKNYLTYNNMINIVVAMSLAGMVAIGQTLLMIAGHMDLSSGALAAVSGVLAATMLQTYHLGTGMTLIIVAIAGAFVGLVNAFLVTVLQFNHFIATLATQSICRGLAFIIANGRSIAITNQTFLRIGTFRVAGIPLPVIIFFVVAIIFGVLLARTRFGRSIYMIGGNPTAARLAGLNERRVKTILFVLASVLTAIGGALLASRMNSGQPNSSVSLEFDAITGAVLGGVALQGGIGTMGGCFIGLIVMTGFNNGLQVMNVQTFWQDVAKGLLLIAALTLDFYRNRRPTKVKKTA